MGFQKNAEAVFKCAEHPKCKIRLVTTGSDWKGPKEHPSFVPNKQCRKCGAIWPCVEFIKRVEVRRNGYGYFVDSVFCRACEPPEAVTLVMQKSKLNMRVELRDERGEPYRLWDKKAKYWGAFCQRGTRRMPGTCIVRLQPYGDRGHDAYGNTYGD